MGYIPPPPPKGWLQPVLVKYAKSATEAMRVGKSLAPDGHTWQSSEAYEVEENCFQVFHAFVPDKKANACHYCGRGRTSANQTCDGCGAPVDSMLRNGFGTPLPNPTRRVYE